MRGGRFLAEKKRILSLKDGIRAVTPSRRLRGFFRAGAWALLHHAAQAQPRAQAVHERRPADPELVPDLGRRAGGEPWGRAARRWCFGAGVDRGPSSETGRSPVGKRGLVDPNRAQAPPHTWHFGGVVGICWGLLGLNTGGGVPATRFRKYLMCVEQCGDLGVTALPEMRDSFQADFREQNAPSHIGNTKCVPCCRQLSNEHWHLSLTS